MNDDQSRSSLAERIHQHFAYSCAYCLSPEEYNDAIFELEHIVPRSAGGETVFENLCLACPLCNRYKSNFQTAPDPETGQEVRLFHPHRDNWLEHFAWLEDGVTLWGLTPVGRVTIIRLKLNRPVLVRLRGLWRDLGVFPPQIS
jgi:hypothetical protein